MAELNHSGETTPGDGGDAPAQAGASRVTVLLRAIEAGQPGAEDQLLPLVYDELRSRAGKLMAAERRNHTLQRTALVHEAYLKIASGGELSFQSRAHFFNAAAMAMRRILVDHATRRATLKRGGDAGGARNAPGEAASFSARASGRARVDLDLIDVAADEPGDPLDWIALDDALKKLREASPRQHEVVMLRFFSGRTEREIAEMLEVSEVTVRRDWATARVWLYRAMQNEN